MGGGWGTKWPPGFFTELWDNAVTSFIFFYYQYFFNSEILNSARFYSNLSSVELDDDGDIVIY